MVWTEDGWLRLACGGNMAQTYVEGSALPDWQPAEIPDWDDFDKDTPGIQYYAPRINPDSFCDLKARPGWLRMRGQEARSSLNRVSILARKLRSVNAEVVTKMEFSPEIHQHSAGLILYYDNMNYAYLRKYWSDTLGGPAISVVRLNNGEKTDFNSARRAAGDRPVWMRLRVEGREYSSYGEFTGCFVGLTCADRVQHRKCADFDFFIYRDLEPELLLGAPMDHR